MEFSSPATQPSSVFLGKLSLKSHPDPVLEVGKKTVRLASHDESIAAILRDPRMENREVRVEGNPSGKEGFEVQKLYTVRNNKLYRVIYFCEVCNITSFKPGKCECCQAPTELTEVPPDDPRVAVK